MTCRTGAAAGMIRRAKIPSFRLGFYPLTADLRVGLVEFSQRGDPTRNEPLILPVRPWTNTEIPMVRTVFYPCPENLKFRL